MCGPRSIRTALLGKLSGFGPFIALSLGHYSLPAPLMSIISTFSAGVCNIYPRSSIIYMESISFWGYPLNQKSPSLFRSPGPVPVLPFFISRADIKMRGLKRPAPIILAQRGPPLSPNHFSNLYPPFHNAALFSLLLSGDNPDFLFSYS